MSTSNGTIKRLVRDKGFGFISTPSGTDMFFHMSNLDGVSFEELREGQKVSYEVVMERGKAAATNLKPA